ncbi:hypothetical protein BJX70DRAFT_79815 [Aspergillus crustosus]
MGMGMSSVLVCLPSYFLTRRPASIRLAVPCLSSPPLPTRMHLLNRCNLQTLHGGRRSTESPGNEDCHPTEAELAISRVSWPQPLQLRSASRSTSASFVDYLATLSGCHRLLNPSHVIIGRCGLRRTQNVKWCDVRESGRIRQSGITPESSHPNRDFVRCRRSHDQCQHLPVTFSDRFIQTNTIWPIETM